MRKATKLYALLGVLLVVCIAAFAISRYPVEEGQGHSRQDLRRVRILGGVLERDWDVSHDEGVRRREGKEPCCREAERILSRQQASGMEDCSSYDAETDPAAGG